MQTTNNKYNLPSEGANNSLNTGSALQGIDDSIDGVYSFSLASGSVTINDTADMGANKARYGTWKSTGVLTANREIIAPTRTWRRLVTNACTGAYTVKVVLVAAGAGVEIKQGESRWVMCDGTAVSFVDDAAVSVANNAVIYKGTDESVAASVVLQNDNDLLFAVGANETWQFEFTIFVESASDVPGIKLALFGPASPTNLRAHILSHGAEAGVSSTQNGLIATAFGSSLDVTYSDPPNTIAKIMGTVENGSNAGNIGLSWAQAVSDATAMFVKRGSYLRAFRVS